MNDVDQTSESSNVNLSFSGERRSEEILVRLQSRLACSTRRARTVRRACAAATAVAVIVATAWISVLWPPASNPNRGGEVVARPEPEETPANTVAPNPPDRAVAHEHPTVTIRVVSSVGERLATCGAESVGGTTSASSADAPRVCVLDDRQLLTALSESGGTYGMIRVNGQTVVLKDDRPLVAEIPAAPSGRGFMPAPAE